MSTSNKTPGSLDGLRTTPFVKFCWLTSSGYEWLERTVNLSKDFTHEEVQAKAQEFSEETRAQMQRLVSGWNRDTEDGETADLDLKITVPGDTTPLGLCTYAERVENAVRDMFPTIKP